MVKLKVIVPIEGPTEWSNSFVAVEKPDYSLRICLDPRELNKAINTPDYKLLTTEEVIAKIGSAKRFTKLDASCAYWQIPLAYESSLLTTFSTPFGRYGYTRMPYGVTSASDVCQMYISQILNGINSVTNSQDDILILADNDKQLEERTIKAFDAIRANGMQLNTSKCRFHLSELIFLVHKINYKGILPDDSKIKAINNMEYPTNVTELQRFLGLINYVGKFLPDLSNRTQSVRTLFKKDTVWTFDANHKKELDELKQLITKAPILKVFVEQLPTKIS